MIIESGFSRPTLPDRQECLSTSGPLRTLVGMDITEPGDLIVVPDAVEHQEETG